MNVTLCSAFRNASGYLDRYFKQVNALSKRLQRRGDYMLLNLAYGDSADGTGEILERACENRHDTNLSEINHNGPEFGSVVNAQRFKQLAYVWRLIWEQLPDVNSSPGGIDAIIFLESDLIWEPSTIIALIDDLAHAPAVAPMVMLQSGAFYDVWAFRKNGRHFRHHPPYWDDDFPFVDMSRPIEIDSAGSCIAIRGDLARQLTWPTEDVIVGVCRQIYELGGSVWLDPTQKVEHP